MNKDVLVITPGDPEGVGPEVTAKSIHALRSKLRNHEILIYGSTKPFQRYQSYFQGLQLAFFEPDQTKSAGFQSASSIELATEFVLRSPKQRALVTGPISKERIQKAGFPFQGHTDFLAKLTKTKEVTMMLANQTFRVSLVTNHCALKDVSKNMTPKKIETTFRHTYLHLTQECGIKKPKIAIMGLNPHAGENGILGLEEKKTLIPTIKKIQKKYKEAFLTGPHPSDSFFALEARKNPKDRCDAIIAIYHDQGLIPVKLLGLDSAVNVTIGLPFLRSSVDHGTAFDIAGRGIASEANLLHVLRWHLAAIDN